ncbi:MAG: flagellar hook-associated protein FlgK [Alphaproteobacteria bacterium]
MALTTGLHAAISGLATAQSGIDLISHNVANVNTEGYTRKVFNQEAMSVSGTGCGVRSSFATRVVDETLQKELCKESGIYEKISIKSSYLTRLQDKFGEPEDDNSIAHTLTDMQTAFSTLATTPNTLSAKSQAVNTASELATQLNDLSEYIQTLRTEADVELTEVATTINSLLERIDSLNSNITRIDNTGIQSSSDLKDQRDEAIKELAELVDITYYERNSGEVVILTKSGKSLLDREPVTVTHERSSMVSAELTYSGDSINGFYAGEFDITKDLTSGKASGLIELRDSILPELQSELDELAVQLRDQVNALHNQGVSSADLPSELTGSRTFIGCDSGDTGTDPLQTISIENGDVRITIFDEDGNQYYTTTLVGDLDFSSGPIYDERNHPDPYEVIPSGDPLVPDEENYTLAATIENWLKDPDGPNLQLASVEVNTDGNLVISLGTSEYGIAIQDTSSSASGSEQQDVTINFDANGDGTNDATYSGFSSFFGLNNFFETTSKEYIHDSDIVSSSLNLGLTAPATLYFSDEGGYSGDDTGINFGSIEILPTESLTDVVNKINNDPTLNERIKAELVKEGSGYRLRIVHADGQQLEITGDTLGTAVLDRLGMGVSSAGVSTTLKVKDEIAESANINTGVVQYDADSGEYFISEADNTLATKLSELFSNTVSFDQAGGFTATDTTFAEYATSIVSEAASQANTTNEDLVYQTDLTDSLELKVGEISGVSLDEELAQLIIFQQAYSASAKVISTITAMLDVLNNMI